MKRFIIMVCAVLLLAGGTWYASLYFGLYIDLNPDTPVTVLFRTQGTEIQRQAGAGAWESMRIRGVDVSSNLPGDPPMDFAPEEEDYLRWFEQIGAMGANTIRTYTLMDDDFYSAFYTYNMTHDDPLYLLQGLQVSDAANYGAEDVYDSDFFGLLLKNGRAVVDVIHGNRIVSPGDTSGTGFYRWDVSEWVVGYLVGSEWDSGNIAYTNNSTTYPSSYAGTYFTTGPDASRFEAAIAQVMDQITGYETAKYKTQRLIGFVNDANNDPFEYSYLYSTRFFKYNQIDAENILPTQELQSGYYAAYRLSYINPEFVQYLSDQQKAELSGILDALDTSDIYHGYLNLLGQYHTMPVIAAGYGFSTSRAALYEGQDPLTEQQQGESLIRVWQDATKAGWAGVFISTWQDVWNRRTWNTGYATLDSVMPVWQDAQSDGQGYGLMEFYLGEQTRSCYVDGDTSEWTQADIVLENEQGSLSMQYDEKYLYFYVQADAFDPGQDILYIPIDTLSSLGSTYCENYGVSFDRACDFVICIDGRDNSRVLVQERYEILWAMHAYELGRADAYDEVRSASSPVFRPINLMVQRQDPVPIGEWYPAVTYETGKLWYGNANPAAADFDSLADFMFTEKGVEIRIPWQMLNFGDPAERKIHDDYYENFGVEYTQIDEMYVGFSTAAAAGTRIRTALFSLEGWGTDVTYHERLKESYYMLQNLWTAA